jgi:prepilin-type N-terminal cleavage/methylation domain-containing protein
VKKYTNFKRQTRGYSIVELLVSMAIISTLSAIAVPSLMRTYRSYQMDDAASQVAAELKFTRYEAIRRNDPTKCLNNTQNGYLTMYTRNLNAPDDNVHPNEKQIMFSGSATLVDAASVPSSASLPAVVGSGITLTTMSPTNGTLTFDGRGAKSTAGVTVYWVGNANYGWRAVTVMPSGSVQVWSYATGTWTQVS